MYDFKKQHEKNVAWVNGQIRICMMARRLLKKYNPRTHRRLLSVECDANNHPELLPLKRLIESEEYWEYFMLAFGNFDRGLRVDVFPVKKWIYEARVLKWKCLGLN